MGYIYLDCSRGIDNAGCSKAQRVNNALAGCLVQRKSRVVCSSQPKQRLFDPSFSND